MWSPGILAAAAATVARVSLVLCGNDLQALGVYEAARQARLRIPHDLAWSASTTSPTADGAVHR
jgi:DNA-binding LacI/PurR family transcriptional regulator